jgi:hypothetical protein
MGTFTQKTFCTLSDVFGSGHHRVLFPLKALEGASLVDPNDPNIEIVTEKSAKDSAIAQAMASYCIDPHPKFMDPETDYAVYRLSRFSTHQQLSMLKHIKENKPDSKIIWDCCDNVLCIEDCNPARSFYTDKVLSGILAFLKSDYIDRIVCSTSNQFDTYKKYGIDPHKIEIVPNTLHSLYYPVKELVKKDFSTKGSINVGWYGSGSYVPELQEIIVPTMIKLAESHPKIKIHLPQTIFGHPTISELAKEISGLETFEWPSPQDLGRFLYESDWDFALDIKMDNEFNRSRTSTKSREANFSGGCHVVANRVEYEEIDDLPSPKVAKIVELSPDDIVEKILEAIENNDNVSAVQEQRRSWQESHLPVWEHENIEGWVKLFGLDYLEETQC